MTLGSALTLFKVPGYLSRYSDSLGLGKSGDRIPVEASFSAPVQTGPGSHPAYYTMGTGSFLGVKRAGRGADHPPHLVLRLKKEYSYIPLLPLLAFVACFRANFTFTVTSTQESVKQYRFVFCRYQSCTNVTLSSNAIPHIAI